MLPAGRLQIVEKFSLSATRVRVRRAKEIPGSERPSSISVNPLPESEVESYGFPVDNVFVELGLGKNYPGLGAETLSVGRGVRDRTIQVVFMPTHV